MPPLVSVVIPAYNAAPYIAETIRSVLAQTYFPLEVIVVDDGSTDGTRDQVKTFGNRVRYLWRRNSGGASWPRNDGVSIATGDYIAFIDADDVMTPERTAAAMAILRRHEDVGLVFTNFCHFDDSGVDPADHFTTCPLLTARLAEHRGADALVLQPGASTDMLLIENFGSSAPIVRRRAIEIVGGYDPAVPPNEDYEFHYRVAARFPIAVIPEVLLHKRRHPGNLSANTPRMLRAQILVRRRMLKEATSARHRRALRQMLATYHLALSYYYTGRDNREATLHALIGMRYRYRPSPRHFARILADVAGRDTNGDRRSRAFNRLQ